ncbi:STAS/SEC14 domain-containing protein [Shewanella sp. SNU WT4]|uniref:STAS/SEC14 domain-containing protein n=1 Tax=Shewanella sp. SNU WT4 TaxID=2590015 RepID=UPI001F0FC391|nr:STAS/SEC14 domain-containing protein [Shewanella sp. SNU WT4]
MMPMVESTIREVSDPDLYLLCDVRELEGWEARAVWDDITFGVKFGRHFEKVTIVGQGQLQQWMTKVASWFMGDDVKFFEDKVAVLAWLKDD